MAETAKSSGLRNVVAGESAISTIDGERGILSYRGIDIHALARHSHFEEVVYLLHRGSLPGREALRTFRAQLARERPIPDALLSVIRALPRASHPMITLRTVVSALGGLDADGADDSLPATSRKAMRLVAQMATAVAAIDRVRNGRAPVAPDAQLSHAANFLYMLSGERPTETAARAMDLALVLHADHEFNASTFTARVAASTLADVHGAITAALATLKGPLHGGANEAVMQALEEIARPERAEEWVRETLAARRKVMGFGHAVYRTEDPRATHLREASHRLGEETRQRKWYDITAALEAAVRGGPKPLNPNVDLYSASLYRALGIPTDLFTPLFAVSRVSGWTAHVLEQLANNKLIRPDSEYVGPRDVLYVPIDQRG
jgi:citrate synthase